MLLEVPVLTVSSQSEEHPKLPTSRIENVVLTSTVGSIRELGRVNHEQMVIEVEWFWVFFKDSYQFTDVFISIIIYSSIYEFISF